MKSRLPARGVTAGICLALPAFQLAVESRSTGGSQIAEDLLSNVFTAVSRACLCTIVSGD